MGAVDSMTMSNPISSRTDLFDKTEAASRLGINWQTVLKHVRLGRLECHKLGTRTYRFDEGQIARFLKRMKAMR